MSKTPLKYLRQEAIEEATALRIRLYAAMTGEAVGFPVPIERGVERALGLGHPVLRGVISDNSNSRPR